MENNREILKIVVVGHVDHGKSTVIGRLLYDTNSLPEGTVNRVKKIAKETGKPFEYAYLLDAFEEEQKQGITIDTTQIQFSTKLRDYVIIDAPGHKEFLKNMISGAANAEAALLIIDAKEGVKEQSKRHAYMLSLLGIKKVYIVLNKMDLVGYSKEVYESIKTEMTEFLETLNVYPLDFIPISAFYGENILETSEKLSWFSGDSIIGAIDRIEKEKGLEEKALRFPIQDVYKFDDRRIIAGKIEQGKLSIGDKVTIYPEGKQTFVKSIEYWAERDKKSTVAAGESVGITFADEFFNKRGELITFEHDTPLISNSFRANIFWMGKQPLETGKKYKIKLATSEVEGEITKIIKVIDASTLDSSEKELSFVERNDVAEVIVKTKELVAFDRFYESNATGRFVLVDVYDVAGGGIIVNKEEIVEEDKDEINATFIYGELKARGDIFEEFYYNAENYNIHKVQAKGLTFTIGDELPLSGNSYQYPKYFDILVLRDKVAIKVREGIVEEIIPLMEYQYGGLPLTNSRGFEIKVSSREEYKKFIAASEDNQDKDPYEFLRQWMKFETFRKVSFENYDWVI